MAAFSVLKPFELSADYNGVHLTPGAVYLPGHDITGLSAAEAGELLLFAPEGHFEPLDAEAITVFEWAAKKRADAHPVSIGEDDELEVDAEAETVVLKVGGKVKAVGKTDVAKGGA